jgi:hypothetical protein
MAFFLLVWLAVLSLFQQKGFHDPGSLWHIKVGERILDHGFMRTDPFTFTHENQPWIPQQWGAEVLMALLHRAGGLDLLLLTFATGVAALFTWIFARMRQAGMHWALAGVLTGACLFPGTFHYFVRPHMFTIAFLAWTMACLVEYDRGRAGRGRLAGLVPLFVVWTNLHGGVICGIASLGLATAGWLVLFVLGRGSPVRSWRTAGLLSAIGVACCLAPLVNPFGLEMVNTWKRLVASGVIKEVVEEHKPIDLTSATGLVVAGFGSIYLVLFAGTLPSRPRVTWLIPVFWFLMTFTGIRQGPLFVITGALVIPDLWPHTVWCRLLRKYGDSLVVDPASVPRPGWAAFALPAAAVLLALGLQLNGVQVPLVGKGWARLDPAFVPVELTPVLEEYARTNGPNARVYNDANLGGYLIYHVPDLKIFMDDRFEQYSDDWVRGYIDVYWNRPEGIEAYADKYGLDLAVVVTGPEPTVPDEYLDGTGKLNRAYSAVIGGGAWQEPRGRTRWIEVERAKCAVIYRRVKP